MAITDSILNYRRFLKRRNYSKYTLRNYMNTLKHFVIWIDVPIEEVDNKKILGFIDHLLDKRLKPKTINCYLDSIRGFYDYLIHEEEVAMTHPVKKGYTLRLSRPLPRYLRDEQVSRLFDCIDNPRDFAMFKLMLRCGLRVEEVSNITLDALDLPRGQLLVREGKGAKDRMVYLSHDAYRAVVEYMKLRPQSRTNHLFLVEKGRFKGKPIMVRGIQHRMQHYAKKAGLKISSHQLRHTMATQMLNADAKVESLQDLLGHTHVKTTQRYAKVSNQKVRRDYYKAMEKVLQRHGNTIMKHLDNEEPL